MVEECSNISEIKYGSHFEAGTIVGSVLTQGIQDLLAF